MRGRNARSSLHPSAPAGQAQCDRRDQDVSRPSDTSRCAKHPSYNGTGIRDCRVREMHCAVCYRRRPCIAGRDPTMRAHLYSKIRSLDSCSCVCLAFLLLPMARPETRIQQPNAARDDQRKPPEYTISVETGLVLLGPLVTDKERKHSIGSKERKFPDTGSREGANHQLLCPRGGSDHDCDPDGIQRAGVYHYFRTKPRIGVPGFC